METPKANTPSDVHVEKDETIPGLTSASAPKRIWMSRRIPAAIAAAALGVTVLVPTATATSAAVPAVSLSPDRPIIEMRPVTTPVFPVFAIAGKGKPVVGARVDIRDRSGTVVVTAQTDSGGIALIEKSKLPERFLTKVTGGTVDGAPSDLVLVSRGSTGAGAVDVDLVTTLIEKVRQSGGITQWTAENRTFASLGLISGVDSATSRFSTNKRFDSGTFLREAARRGGVAKFMRNMAPRIIEGEKLPFRPMAMQRSSADDLLNDATGDLGGYLALPKPGGDVQAAAQQAAAALQTALTDLLGMQWYTTILVNQSIYTTETTKVAMVESGTKYVADEWTRFTQTSPSASNYSQLQNQLFNDINSKVNAYYQTYESLFPGASSGVLKAGHSVFQSSYQYYIPSDVDQIQGMVSYWETLAAASNFYIVNLYNASNESGLVSGQNAEAQSWDGRILRAMPDDLGASEVGIWQQGRAYATSSSLYSKGYYYLDYKKITDMADAWGNCDSWGGGYSGTGSPTYITADQLRAIVYGMVPSGYYLAAASDSQYLSGTRAGGSPIINYIKAQDQGLQYLTYSDTQRVFGQSHTYKDSSGKTHHDWKGETICYATDIRSNGTTVNNQPQLNEGLVLTAWVYLNKNLKTPAAF